MRYECSSHTRRELGHRRAEERPWEDRERRSSAHQGAWAQVLLCGPRNSQPCQYLTVTSAFRTRGNKTCCRSRPDCGVCSGTLENESTQQGAALRQGAVIVQGAQPGTTHGCCGLETPVGGEAGTQGLPLGRHLCPVGDLGTCPQGQVGTGMRSGAGGI